jgi:hypothetical protein
MSLKYRGVSYDYTPPQVEMQSADIVGQYRGLEWRFRNPKRVPVLQSNLDLVYRGVSYRTGQPSAIPEPEVAPIPERASAPVLATAGRSVKDMARSLMVGHHNLIKNREQSLLGRVAIEVGLGADAAHYWNHIQGKVHPSFRRSYDRSHAALS